MSPDRETLLVPKDIVVGMMISPFHSREFGFGFSWNYISDYDLKRMNDFRADKANMGKDTAYLLRNGRALKKYLSRGYNTFVVLFEYSNYDNKQGYWRYEHLVYKWNTSWTALRFCIHIFIRYFYLIIFVVTNGHVKLD